MHVTWHGHYTIKIQTGSGTLVIDPYSPDVGLRPLRVPADVVLLSHPADPEMSHSDAVLGDPVILSGPGEYHVRDMTISAIPWRADDNSERTIQRLVVEKISLLNLGKINRILSNAELQEIEKTNIDVLFVPVGGGSSLNASQAAKLITTFEPRMIIPVHFHVSNLNGKLDSVEAFIKEIGLKPTREKKIIIKPNRLPKEDTEVVVLSV